MLILPRRKFIASAAALICAPAIVRAQTLQMLGSGSVKKPGGGGSVTAQDLFGRTMFNSTSPVTVPLTNAGNAIIATWNPTNIGLTTPSVTWNGVAMTQIGSFAYAVGGNVYVFGLVSAFVGSANLVYSSAFDPVVRSYGAAMSFSGVNATFGTAFTSFQTGTASATNSVSTSSPVSCPTGSQLFAGTYSDNGGTQASINLTNDLVNSGTIGFFVDDDYRYENGSGSKTVTGSFTGNGGLGVFGLSVNP